MRLGHLKRCALASGAIFGVCNAYWVIAGACRLTPRRWRESSLFDGSRALEEIMKCLEEESGA